jgi:hypothetical protein
MRESEIMKKLILVVALLFSLTLPVLAQEKTNHSSPVYAATSSDSETINDASRLNDLVNVKMMNGKTTSSDFEQIKIKSFGFEYFPLKKDMAYTYDSNAGETEAEVSSAKNELVLTYNAGSITYEQQFFIGEKGIYLTRTETSAFLFFGSKVTYPEPVLRLPLPLETGATWRWVGLEVAGGDTGKLTITGQALGEEKVETPIGIYTCLKIQMLVESEMGSRNTVTEWLAPNIGVIKFHAQLEGSGITGFLQDLMGLDEITFDLTGIAANKT